MVYHPTSGQKNQDRSYTTPRTLRRSHLLYPLAIPLILAAGTILRSHTSLGGIKVPLSCRPFGVLRSADEGSQSTKRGPDICSPFLFSYSLLDFLVLNLISGFEAHAFCSLSFHLYISHSSPSQGAISPRFARFQRSEVRTISRVVLVPPLLSLVGFTLRCRYIQESWFGRYLLQIRQIPRSLRPGLLAAY